MVRRSCTGWVWMRSTLPDSPRASARMSAQSLCVQIQQHVGIETILHYTCRDRNVLSIQSDFAGGVVDWAEEYSLPDGRSAEAGELSECDGCVRCGCDWVGEYRPQLELRVWTWGRTRSGSRRVLRSRWRRTPVCRTWTRRCGGLPIRLRRGRSLRSRSRCSICGVLRSFCGRIEEFRIPVIAGSGL